MFKTVALVVGLMVGQLALADGKLSMDFQPQSGRFLMDATRTSNEIKGSISPARMNPFISLKKVGESKWQGQLSQQIASTEVKAKGNGKLEITISALPGGFYSYTFVTKQNGDIEVNGTGPTGNLNSAGLKKSGTEIYFGNIDYSHDLKNVKAGRYEGTVVAGGANSGEAYLTTEGDMDPKALAAQDPALFVLFYVFPFSR